MMHAEALRSSDITPWTRLRLTEHEVEAFQRRGYLHVPSALTVPAREAMIDWVNGIQTWPERAGAWMMYFEDTQRGHGRARTLCRMERFLEFHSGFDALLSHPVLMGMLGQLMGEPAVLFKEKINFKLPGGSGFAPHQDAPAFAAFGQRFHITAMICVDHANAENGCLEIAHDPCSGTILRQADDGTIHPEELRRLTFSPLPARPGDLILFDSFVPHRSEKNRTHRPRRALYVTYNRLSEGLRREDYYRDKRQKFPPECERIPGHDYSAGAAMYNLANPIRA